MLHGGCAYHLPSHSAARIIRCDRDGYNRHDLHDVLHQHARIDCSRHE